MGMKFVLDILEGEFLFWGQKIWGAKKYFLGEKKIGLKFFLQFLLRVFFFFYFFFFYNFVLRYHEIWFSY